MGWQIGSTAGSAGGLAGDSRLSLERASGSFHVASPAQHRGCQWLSRQLGCRVGSCCAVALSAALVRLALVARAALSHGPCLCSIMARLAHARGHIQRTASAKPSACTRMLRAQPSHPRSALSICCPGESGACTDAPTSMTAHRTCADDRCAKTHA